MFDDMISHMSLAAFIHIIFITLSSFKSSFAFSPFRRVSYCNQRDTLYIKYPMLQRVGNRLIHQYSRSSSRTMSISSQNIDTLHPQEDMNSQEYRQLVIVLAGPTAVGKSDVAAKLCSFSISSDIIRGHSKSIHT